MQPLSLKTRISTPHFEQTQSFYQDLFGLIVVEDWDEPGDRGVILAFHEQRMDALLEIYRSDNAASFDGTSLQIRVADVDAFVARARDRVVFEGPKERPWGSRYVYLRDPNDIQVIVYDGNF